MAYQASRPQRVTSAYRPASFLQRPLLHPGDSFRLPNKTYINLTLRTGNGITDRPVRLQLANYQGALYVLSRHDFGNELKVQRFEEDGTYIIYNDGRGNRGFAINLKEEVNSLVLVELSFNERHFEVGCDTNKRYELEKPRFTDNDAIGKMIVGHLEASKAENEEEATLPFKQPDPGETMTEIVDSRSIGYPLPFRPPQPAQNGPERVGHAEKKNFEIAEKESYSLIIDNDVFIITRIDNRLRVSQGGVEILPNKVSDQYILIESHRIGLGLNIIEESGVNKTEESIELIVGNQSGKEVLVEKITPRQSTFEI